MFKKTALVSLSLLSAVACNVDSSDSHGPAKERSELVFSPTSLVSKDFPAQSFSESDAAPMVFAFPLQTPLKGGEKALIEDLKEITALELKVEGKEGEEPSYEALEDDLFDILVKDDEIVISIKRHLLSWNAATYRLSFAGGKVGDAHYFAKNDGTVVLDFEVAALNRSLLAIEKPEVVELDVLENIKLSDEDRANAKKGAGEFKKLQEKRFGILDGLDTIRIIEGKLAAEEDEEKKAALDMLLESSKSDLAISINGLSDKEFCGEDECADRKDLSSESENLLTMTGDLLPKLQIMADEFAAMAYHRVPYTITSYQFENEEGVINATVQEQSIDFSTLIQLQGQFKFYQEVEEDGEKVDKIVSNNNYTNDFDPINGTVSLLVKKEFIEKLFSNSEEQLLGRSAIVQSDLGFTDLEKGFSVQDQLKVDVTFKSQD